MARRPPGEAEREPKAASRRPDRKTEPSFSGAKGMPEARARRVMAAAWPSRLTPSIRRIGADEAATWAPRALASTVMATREAISAAHSSRLRAGIRPHRAPSRSSSRIIAPWPSPIASAITALTVRQATSTALTGARHRRAG